MVQPTLTKQASADTEHLYNLIDVELGQVRQSLMALDVPESKLLQETMGYTLENTGKLLRPTLTLLMSGATGQINTSHIETAAVAELIHIATLLHDDVLDDSDVRRGQPTLRAEWGNKVSILSGDYLLAQASVKLAALNNCRLVSIFAHVLANLSNGELEQVRTSYQLDASWDSYFRKTFCKTASLFSACCESAGVINDLPEEHITLLQHFGEKLGIAFQIIDDLLDYTGSEQRLGKPVLDDLKNGIINAPVLLALDSTQTNPTLHNALKQDIKALFTSPDTADTEGLLQCLADVNAIEQTYAMAQQHVEEAWDMIQFLPNTPHRDALFQLTQYAIQRDK